MTDHVTEHTSSDEATAKVADLIKDIRVAMLTHVDPTGRLVSHPMATQEVEFDGDVLFVAERDSHKCHDIDAQSPARRSTSPIAQQLSWVSSVGHRRDRRRPRGWRSCWNTFTDAWMEGGPENPNNVLIKVQRRLRGVLGHPRQQGHPGPQPREGQGHRRAVRGRQQGRRPLSGRDRFLRIYSWGFTVALGAAFVLLVVRAATGAEEDRGAYTGLAVLAGVALGGVLALMVALERRWRRLGTGPAPVRETRADRRAARASSRSPLATSDSTPADRGSHPGLRLQAAGLRRRRPRPRSRARSGRRRRREVGDGAVEGRRPCPGRPRWRSGPRSGRGPGPGSLRRSARSVAIMLAAMLSTSAEPFQSRSWRR